MLGLFLMLMWLVLFVLLLLMDLAELTLKGTDALPMLRPTDPLRQDALVSAVVLIATVPWVALSYRGIGLLAFVAPFVASRAWVRYMVCVAVGRARGTLPLRPAHFLAWAHQAGLLRVTGRTYQFRHQALQEWLVAEHRRRAEIPRLIRLVKDESVQADQRLRAAETLFTTDSIEGAFALMRLADDAGVGPWHRMRAMEVLAGMELYRRHAIGVGVLIAYAAVPRHDPGTFEYRWAVEGLAGLDPHAAGTLLTELTGSLQARDSIQVWAAHALAEMGPRSDTRTPTRRAQRRNPPPAHERPLH